MVMQLQSSLQIVLTVKFFYINTHKTIMKQYMHYVYFVVTRYSTTHGQNSTTMSLSVLKFSMRGSSALHDSSAEKVQVVTAPAVHERVIC